MKRELLASTWLFLLLSACGEGQDICQTGNRLTINRPELKDALIEDLREAGIAFEQGAESQICYPASAEETVRGRLIAIDRVQRANQRTIAGGEFAERVLQRLQQDGIAFTFAEQDDGRVLLIIEDREEMGAVERIIGEVAADIFGPE